MDSDRDIQQIRPYINWANQCTTPLITRCTRQLFFCDLAKALDTISHTILLETLFTYGIRGTANKVLESYLCGRRQSGRINGHVSSLTKSFMEFHKDHYWDLYSFRFI